MPALPMALRAWLLAGLVGLAGCAGPRAIAVVNDTDQPYVVTFRGERAWEVPAHSAGIGPVDIIMGWSQTDILREDCFQIAGWRLQGPTTIQITDAGAFLQPGARSSNQLSPTTHCLGAN